MARKDYPIIQMIIQESVSGESTANYKYENNGKGAGKLLWTVSKIKNGEWMHIGMMHEKDVSNLVMRAIKYGCSGEGFGLDFPCHRFYVERYMLQWMEYGLRESA